MLLLNSHVQNWLKRKMEFKIKYKKHGIYLKKKKPGKQGKWGKNTADVFSRLFMVPSHQQLFRSRLLSILDSQRSSYQMVGCVLWKTRSHGCRQNSCRLAAQVTGHQDHEPRAGYRLRGIRLHFRGMHPIFISSSSTKSHRHGYIKLSSKFRAQILLCAWTFSTL